MAQHDIRLYSEHLSSCGDDGQLYDLMPIPFTEEAVTWVADRVRRVQDILEQRIALENVSYYTPLDTTMSEREFLLAVLEEADCDLMLDINNIVVNSINHRYDASEFLRAMPAQRIRYFHLAGHYVEDEDLRIDTHGSPVDEQAWSLLSEAYGLFGPVPTLLERDFNIPPIEGGSRTDSTRSLPIFATHRTSRPPKASKIAAWRSTVSCSSTTCLACWAPSFP